MVHAFCHCLLAAVEDTFPARITAYQTLMIATFLMHNASPHATWRKRQYGSWLENTVCRLNSLAATVLPSKSANHDNVQTAVHQLRTLCQQAVNMPT